MNTLGYGLTPKMEPISPRRSALVAALDVGSSKVVCMIARLRPRAPQQVLTRRSHGIEIIGFGHTVARGMKAGASSISAGPRKPSARPSMPPSAWPVSRSSWWCCRCRRAAFERTVYRRDRNRRFRHFDHDIARVLAAGSRIRCARAAPFCTRCRWATLDGVAGVRDPHGMLASRFGVDMHVATIDIAAARNLMLAVERCHLGVEAMVASPYVAGLSVLADDEADLGSIVGRSGRRHHQQWRLSSAAGWFMSMGSRSAVIT